MNTMSPLALGCALLIATAGAAHAGSAPPGPAASCELPIEQDAHPFSDRSGTLERFRQLAPECLKRVFVACSQTADRALLDPGSAAICSLSYEALLSRGFNGDFRALVAWWRSVPREQVQ